MLPREGPIRFKSTAFSELFCAGRRHAAAAAGDHRRLCLLPHYVPHSELGESGGLARMFVVPVAYHNSCVLVVLCGVLVLGLDVSEGSRL